MPNETQQAVDWALNQCLDDGFELVCVTSEQGVNRHLLVDFVRKYFNDNNIEYGTFSAKDLEPFLN